MHTELHKQSPSVVENNKQNWCGVHIYSHEEQKHVEHKYRDFNNTFTLAAFYHLVSRLQRLLSLLDDHHVYCQSNEVQRQKNTKNLPQFISISNCTIHKIINQLLYSNTNPKAKCK